MSQTYSVILCRCRLLLIGLWTLWLLVPGYSARAQETQWLEQRTAHFALLFPRGSEQVADEYATFVDGVYDEVSAVFSYRTPPPVVLRIYPTMDLYHQANPLAAQMPGVVAHAHTGRREISIALPQTANQTQNQIVNNVRHELAHIIAADLSGDKLTTAFQEGIAQYVEHPSEELDAKMQLMQQVMAANRVLPWRELNRPGVAYADPRIGYPQSYTIVAFLIERSGFATFLSFLEQTKTSSGYRGALEAAYGVSADQLEREWLAQLESFVNGGYRGRGVGAFDLTQAKALIGRGEYGEAAQALQAGLTALQASGQTAIIEEAQMLLERAENGQRMKTLADKARVSLERGEYAQARQAADQGRALMNELGQPAQMKVMDEYRKLATDGIAAQQQLGEAGAALKSLRVEMARERLANAYRTFSRLGDEQGAAMALGSLVKIQRIETAVAIGFVVLAALVLGWNVHRRVNERDRVLPFG